MNDATNAFHWTLESFRARAGWSAQSYAFGANPLARARLVVVYDLHSPAYQKYAAALKAWVRGGGKLLIFDPLARAGREELLEGVEFTSDSSYRGAAQFAFTEAAHPLLKGLAASRAPADLVASVRQASPDWKELAYTVLANSASRQFYVGYETFGPRWTSLMDTARAPVMLARDYGKGSIVLAQVGSPSVRPRRDMAGADLQEVPAYVRTLAQNLIAWAGGPE
jgi:hypothetical protein